jgi:hypothetical protein
VKRTNKQKDKATAQADELREHYDFDYTQAKPNRFAQRLNQAAIVVTLDPDVAAVFQTSESVNDALRVFITALGNLSQTPSIPEKVKSHTTAT